MVYESPQGAGYGAGVEETAAGPGWKYYDSKQQETVMDRRERGGARGAAFPLYKSPAVLTYC